MGETSPGAPGAAEADKPELTAEDDGAGLDSAEPPRRPTGLVRAVFGPARKLRDAIMEGVYPRKDQIEHLEHLASIRESRAHDYLYGCLSILDTKAAALLQFDGIIVAAATVAVTFFPKVSFGNPLVILSLILSGLSSMFCLQVIWVYWTKTVEFAAEQDEFVELLRCRNKRTVLYRCSWLTAQVSVFFLLLGISVRQF